MGKTTSPGRRSRVPASISDNIKKTGPGMEARPCLSAKIDLFPPAHYAVLFFSMFFSAKTACAAANLATGTRKGEQLT